MTAFHSPITEDQLLKYGNFLYTNIKNANHIPYKEVLIKGERAAPNNCHNNARFFVEENPGHHYQDGWLCLIGEGSPLAMFLAHTVVIDSAGNYFDVTPVFSLDPRPFLPANIDEDSFAELIQYLFATRNSSVFSLNI